MATEIRKTIRNDIGDDNPLNERFTDDQLNTFIDTGLKRLNRRIALTITITDGVLSAVPSSSQYDLIVLQTECIIGKRENYAAIRRGVRVKQDENEVDMSAGLGSFKEYVQGGVCQELEDALAEYIASGAVELSSAVSDNAEIIWSGNQKVYEDIDHSGQQSERIWTPREDGHIKRDGDGSTDDRFTCG